MDELPRQPKAARQIEAQDESPDVEARQRLPEG